MMQIKEIVLYNAAGDTRRLPFRIGAVNIISGSSKTGKSALIDIVEYCLGREDYSVPVGAIREAVEWFGLLLQFPGTECFVARREPGRGRKSNSEVYFELGTQISIPTLADLVPNTNAEALIGLLSELSGIAPNQHEPPPGTSRLALEASLKHALFLVFQRQDEIAKRTLLFHRQDEDFIPQAIKDTIPYFLGAVPDDRLAVRHALRRERVLLRDLERQQRELEALRGGGLPRALSLLAEAENVGLLTRHTRPDSLAESVTLLRSIAASVTEVEGGRAGVGDALARSREERQDLSQRYQRVRAQIDSVRSLQHARSGYVNEATAQRDRLSALELFDDPPEGLPRCPVCDSQLEHQTPDASALRESLHDLTAQLSQVQAVQPRLQEYIGTLDEEASRLQSALRDNQRVINALVAQDRSLQERRDLHERQSYVLGRVSVYLENVPSDEVQPEDLSDAIAAARARVDAIERELRDEKVQEILDSIMNVIGRQMSSWAERLELEHARYPLRIDLSQLMVVADTETGPVPMSKMGSGENWVGYHIIAHLALHRHFVQMNRPVPRFLFFDQPTQVYYPPERDADGRLDILKDEDRAAVQRMFALILDVAAELAPNLQIVITDHADIDDDRFQQSVIARWRGGEKLVPQEWLTG